MTRSIVTLSCIISISYTALLHLLPAACWEQEPHSRPTFETILKKLDEISRSNFTQTPHESFHTMQGHWKVEIEEKVNEIRMKENVSRTCLGGPGWVIFLGDFVSLVIKGRDYRIYFIS